MGEPPSTGTTALESSLRSLDINLARSLRGDQDAMQHATEATVRVLWSQMPRHWADIATDALLHVSRLPVTLPFTAGLVGSAPQAHRSVPLPPWLPPSRVLGGFYVLRPLGTGSVGSVFAACRAEERGLRQPTRFALKVPEYGGDVARSLSQEEFLRLFREEAGALLAVPDQRNLARLVTFDAGARPKPILVMELVEGPTLQRQIDTAALDTREALALLDGVAAGLEAMHGAGVGHLDVKPSNVILREPDDAPVSESDFGASGAPSKSSPSAHAPIPVLVDFGLAGRKVRPGCATVHYGAPEVWGHLPDGVAPDPAAVDVYAFGCLVFETLTTHDLFDGPSQMSIISSHIKHDGNPPCLVRMGSSRVLGPLATLIRGAIRRDPRDRLTLRELRDGLRGLTPLLAERPWPLPLPSEAQALASNKVSLPQAPLPLLRRRSPKP